MDAGKLSNKCPQSLEEWTELLRLEEMPIFSNTSQNIYLAMDDTKKDAMEMASIILHEHEGVWLTSKQNASLYTAQIQSQLGLHECFVFPIQVGAKAMGMIYCDRGLSRQALTTEDFSAAKHFAKQAQRPDFIPHPKPLKV